ncbi:DUF4221 family protein [Lunatimonas salinarum]|uniref:DUF4221 family protein n=1 Tax=Lunatimonas salinarum TaxID=1774590 RepID=UPI001ADF44ED|nr:DUF4221 family protein [Lunatimonas salinarum]
MKKLKLLLLPLLTFYACSSSNQEATEFGELVFSLDTLMIDPKDEILFLQGGFRWSDTSSDRRYFYNFNYTNSVLEVIDLNKLELERVVAYEKEGPNGTGGRVGKIHYLGQDSLYFSSHFDHEIFDLKGRKILSHTTKNVSFSGGEFGENEALPMPVMWSKQPHRIVGLGRKWIEPETSFVSIDFSQRTFDRRELPAFDILNDFHYTMEQPQVWFGPEYATSIVGETVLFSISVASPIYRYHIPSNELELHRAIPSLTAGEKTVKPPKQVSNREEYRPVDRMLREQINFQHPIWDETRGIFYRFTYQEIFPQNPDEPDPYRKAKVYLTLLDRDLSIVSEHEVPVIDFVPVFPFVKDGAIWMPVNVADELGFARLTMRSAGE